MTRKQLKPVFELLVFSALAFVVHMLAFQFLFSGRDANFMYSLPELYGFFVLFSVVILLVLIKMKQSNLDSVGNTFMLLTFIKMGIAYWLMQPIINAQHTEAGIEKANFFIIFLLFLAIETTVAIRLLNRTQP